jgi:predicted metal-dependent phosphoesterase TrpH
MSDNNTTPLIRADLHNHSYYSPDSILSPEYFLSRARKRRLTVIAVTDHNTTRGGCVAAELAARMAPEIRVIVGEEVRTRDGEILGLFLTEDIPRELSAAETIDRIHSQGGVAGAPHPLDPYRGSLGGENLGAVADKLDFMEGLNARMITRGPNDRALEFASQRGIPLSAASDAHSPREIGRAYVQMPDFTTPTEFLDSLRAGKLSGRLSSPLIHLISRYATVRHKLGWRPPE